MEYTFTLKRNNRKEGVKTNPKKPSSHWTALNLGSEVISLDLVIFVHVHY
jgi:hypothetical protein